jgi:Inner membrane protein YgaP-like, transmembrane domain
MGFKLRRGLLMNANVGGIDKILRLVTGAVLIGLTLTDVIGMWGWVGIIPLVTGLVNWCPLYPLIGLNTSSKKA